MINSHFLGFCGGPSRVPRWTRSQFCRKSGAALHGGLES